jgi:hypothetical protein
MAIEFVCPACGGTLQVSDESAGRVVRCGGCMTMLRVPEAAPTDSSAPASPFERDNPPPAPARASRGSNDRTPAPRRDEPSAESPADRRRRSRRRRPTAPPGRGLFFWLVVLGGMMLFGVVACCGGIFLILPGPQWHTHESDNGGFKVELPAPAQKNFKTNGVKQQPGTTTEGTILASRLEVYAVAYRDIPRLANEEKALDDAVADMRNDGNVRQVIRSEPVTVSGFPGREVEFRGADGGIYVARIVVAGSRLYQVIGGGQFSKPGNPNVRRFLDSFEITGQRQAEGKRRQDQARLAAEALRQAQEREERRKAQLRLQEAAEAVGESVNVAAVEARLAALRAQDETRRLALHTRLAAAAAAGSSLAVAEREFAAARLAAAVRGAAAGVAATVADVPPPRLPVAPPPRPIDEP